MIVEDLGCVPYREAWKYQDEVHARVVAGEEQRLLLVEHPHVLTFGRRPGVAKNMLAAPEELAKMGVEVVESNRGGDITYHGPGQIVAYPIVRLLDHQLSISGYVHALEELVMRTLADLGVAGAKQDPCAVGVWVPEGPGARASAGEALAKVCAIGVRIRKGATLHGLALNVTTDLRYFNLIVPCGLVGRPVTSLQKLLGKNCPPLERVKTALVRQFLHRFATEASA
jgi:lipoate-protein ligase B